MKHILFISLLFSGIYLFSQNPSKNSEIYDYSIGDVFHIEAWGDMWGSSELPHFYKKKVIDKYYSVSKDTLTYQFSVNETNPHYDGFTMTWVTKSYNEKQRIGNLDSTLIDVDSVRSIPEIYNGRFINFYFETDSFENNNEVNFGVGLGAVYYHIVLGLTYDRSERLVYFKKGSEEWGKKLTVGFESIDQELNINIYPNPMYDVLSVEVIGVIGEPVVKLFDMNAKLSMQKKLRNGMNRIELLDVKSGFYFIQIENENQVIYRNKIVKH